MKKMTMNRMTTRRNSKTVMLMMRSKKVTVTTQRRTRNKMKSQKMAAKQMHQRMPVRKKSPQRKFRSIWSKQI